MKAPLKRYLLLVLTRLHLYDAERFELNIDRLYADDLFVVSYPKSGNTWLRFLIAAMTDAAAEITFDRLDAYVHGLHTAKKQINSKKEKRVIKSHYPFFRLYPKTIYIYRDYRDVLVSFYHYQVALAQFEGTFSAFIRSENVNQPYGSWKAHITRALQHREKHPEKILLLKYEDLLDDNGQAAIGRISDFTGIRPELPAQTIAARCSFESLRKNEDAHGSDFKKRSSKNFFREGKAGDWKNYFSKEDLDYILATHAEVLLKLGYSTN